jgi:hypothetical protein
MAIKYLDDTGLAQLVSDVKTYVDGCVNYIKTDVVDGVNWSSFNTSVFDTLFGSDWVTTRGVYGCRAKKSDDTSGLTTTLGYSSQYYVEFKIWYTTNNKGGMLITITDTDGKTAYTDKLITKNTNTDLSSSFEFMPTQTSQLTNNSGFITNAVDDLTNYYLKSETYTQTEVNALIGAIKTITFEIVQTLPTADATTYFNDSKTVYMIRNSASTGSDYYEEYITVRAGTEGSYTYSWEKIGDTQIDLSNYVTLDSAQTISGEKTFSSNVTFDNNVGVKGKATSGTSYDLIKMLTNNNIILGDRNTQGQIMTYRSIRPFGGYSPDLGTDAQGWRHLYLSGKAYISTINNGGDITVPQTSGTMALTSDLTNYVTLDGTQTITGAKTFDDSINISTGKAVAYAGDGIILSPNKFVRFGNANTSSSTRGSIAVLANSSSSKYFRPGSSGNMDLGTTSYSWKDIILTGVLKGATTYGLQLPDATNWTANKTVATTDDVASKQDTLVSGTNIKTINNQSILGSGNINISGGSATDVQVDSVSITSNNVADLKTMNGNYNASTNKIATASDLSGKVSTTSTANQVYATDGSGSQTTLSYQSSQTDSANKIVQRDANRDVLVPSTPTSNNGATSKSYVDNKTQKGYLSLSFFVGSTNRTYNGTDNNLVDFANGTITTKGGALLLNMSLFGKLSGGGTNTIVIFVDNVNSLEIQTTNTTDMWSSGSQILENISSGTHTITLKQKANNNQTFTLLAWNTAYINIIEI